MLLKSHYGVVAYSCPYPHDNIHSLIMYAYVLHGDTQKNARQDVYMMAAMVSATVVHRDSPLFASPNRSLIPSTP